MPADPDSLPPPDDLPPSILDPDVTAVAPRGDEILTDREPIGPDDAFLPPAFPTLPTVATPSAPSPVAVAARLGVAAAIAIAFAKKVLEELLEKQQDDIEADLKAHEEMIERKIAKRARDRRVRTTAKKNDVQLGRIDLPSTETEAAAEMQAEGTGDIQLPPGRDLGVGDLPQFPFDLDFDGPVGKGGKPGIPVIIAPIELPEIRIEPEIPAPAPLPQPETLPETPTAPSQQPKPAPTKKPAPSPAPAPFRFPWPFPSPFSSPSPLRFRQPLTYFDPRTVPSPPEQPSPQAQAQPHAFGIPTQTSQCPPCEDDPDSPRDECFKVLVKESLFPSDDERFDWVEIDCLTGKEL